MDGIGGGPRILVHPSTIRRRFQAGGTGAGTGAAGKRGDAPQREADPAAVPPRGFSGREKTGCGKKHVTREAESGKKENSEPQGWSGTEIRRTRSAHGYFEEGSGNRRSGGDLFRCVHGGLGRRGVDGAFRQRQLRGGGERESGQPDDAGGVGEADGVAVVPGAGEARAEFPVQGVAGEPLRLRVQPAGGRDSVSGEHARLLRGEGSAGALEQVDAPGRDAGQRDGGHAVLRQRGIRGGGDRLAGVQRVSERVPGGLGASPHDRRVLPAGMGVQQRQLHRRTGGRAGVERGAERGGNRGVEGPGTDGEGERPGRVLDVHGREGP